MVSRIPNKSEYYVELIGCVGLAVSGLKIDSQYRESLLTEIHNGIHVQVLDMFIHCGVIP